jgi:transglutaminase-like putative cysteine protease
MARTALLCALPALLVASGWSQLEARPEGGDIALVAALGVAAALPSRRWLQLVGAVAGFLAAAGLAFGVSPLDARPFHDRDFFGPLVSGTWNGALDYYQIAIPFDPAERPRMHGALLLAVFGFTLGASLAIARRRPVLASALTFAGAAWPVTLIRDAPSTARGALLLVAALILLAALRSGAGRGAGQTALVGGAVLVAALVAVSSPAVAKGGFLNWEQWEPYKRPDRPVSVSYVWDDADYDGIRFPKRPTTVLTVKAPRRAPYWRATTLDSFLDDHWRHDQLEIEPTEVGGLDVLLDDPLLPQAAADPDTWMEQVVEVHALRDDHLVAASVPVAFERGEAVYYEPGVAYVERLRRGQDYRAWSYVPELTPEDLAASPAAYPDEVKGDQYLGTGFGDSAPPFRAPGRDKAMRQIFSDGDASVYRPLYDTALEVAGRPRNPYAAVVALEAWFRQSGDFEYDETPPARAGVPPLVAFVNDHRRGYCQHFAGAMALMLRYLGIPARVAAGFTSGQYDTEDREWTVSDKNAHTWVEAWFAGYGWLPFDPTPGAGRLRGEYSASSLFFDVNGAAGAFGAGAASLGLQILRDRLTDGGPNAANDRVRGLDPGAGAAGSEQSAAADDGGGGGSLIALLLVIAGALTTGLWLIKLVRRRLRYLTRDPRRLAGAVRLDLVDYLVDQRVRVSSSATPAELGRELEHGVGVEGDRLAYALAAARYGPEDDAEAAARRARRELREVRSRLRRRLSTRARLRGLLSLRSLGLGSA